MRGDSLVEANLRLVLPLVTAALVRRYGDLAGCEDAVQDAALDAVVAWQRSGVPDDPRAWLFTVARRRYIDAVRSESAQRRREQRDAVLDTRGAPATSIDDSLAMLALCCHPAVPVDGQVALTLRVVCGLTTAQIAAAFYSSEAAMARRITRAKRAIDDAGRAFPAASDLADRAEAIRTTLYVMFTEGHAPHGSEVAVHDEMVSEAIRLTRMLRAALPDDPQTCALLALMLLAAARGPARSSADGAAVALPDQDRSAWDAAMIAEGRGLAAEALAARPLTSLAIQAAIQAVHAAAPSAAETDWQQILALYDALLLRDASPAVRLGRAVAVGMARGPLAGLAELSVLGDDARVAHDPRLLAVRAGLLEQSGATDQAASTYAEAAQMTTNAAERRWLDERARRARRNGEEPQ